MREVFFDVGPRPIGKRARGSEPRVERGALGKSVLERERTKGRIEGEVREGVERERERQHQTEAPPD